MESKTTELNVGRITVTRSRGMTLTGEEGNADQRLGQEGQVLLIYHTER